MVRGSLRGIEFEDTDCHIYSIKPQPTIEIGWKLKRTTQNLNNLFFFIYRGESPSELKRINSEPIPSNVYPHYMDTTVKLLMFHKNYYYQVVAEEIINGTTVNKFPSKVFTWQGSLDIQGMYIVDEHLFAFRHVFGIPAFLYKKKNEGVRCTNCWDSVLKRVTKSNCTSCFGTGFLQGYYPSIPIWIDLNPDPSAAQIADFGVKEPGQTDCLFIHYPLLQLGDIILELESFRFWRVVNDRTSEKNRNTLLQVARLDEVNRSDVEQSLEVDQELRSKLLKELDNRQKIPEF